MFSLSCDAWNERTGAEEARQLFTIEYVGTEEVLKDSTSMDMLFTGHVACDFSNNTHASSAGGVTWTHVNEELGYSGMVIFTWKFNNIITSNNSKNGIIEVMFHETIHDFGIEHCDESESCILCPNLSGDDVGKDLSFCINCFEFVQS